MVYILLIQILLQAALAIHGFAIRCFDYPQPILVNLKPLTYTVILDLLLAVFSIQIQIFLKPNPLRIARETCTKLKRS